VIDFFIGLGVFILTVYLAMLASCLGFLFFVNWLFKTSPKVQNKYDID